MINKRQHVVNSERPVRTTAGDAFSLFAITALRLAGHLTKEGDGIARPAGQSSARWQVLAGARHATMSVAQIARTLGLSRQAVQRLANVLEAEGLIALAENPHDRRAPSVVLTAQGQTKLALIDEAQAVWADRWGAQFGEAMLQQVTTAITYVLDALHEQS